MANTDFARGLWPVRLLSSGNTFVTKDYKMVADKTIVKGDVVEETSAGLVTTNASITGTRVVGVAAETVTSPASSTSTTVAVYNDPNIVFGIQGTDSVSLAQTHVGNTANVTGNGGSGSLSAAELSTPQATSAQLLKVIGLLPTVGNEWGEHADVEVIFNQHAFKGAGLAGT